MDWQEFKGQCTGEQIVSIQEKLYTSFHLIIILHTENEVSERDASCGVQTTVKYDTVAPLLFQAISTIHTFHKFHLSEQMA
ncbi:uncharacterized protein LOC135147665 isoform X2 [Daucus carota subsp. sativus]|uniref:uncharacterized protein LOC135147665 isoform X2 n=1 Tax=Daucus carota subsp. sativus TaxID=79200 RepID=UPI003082DBF3